jgi:hypothetical protein
MTAGAFFEEKLAGWPMPRATRATPPRENADPV